MTSFEEIMGYYRWAWLDGTPLILPIIPYGEDLTLPIVDDCGYCAFMLEVDAHSIP